MLNPILSSDNAIEISSNLAPCLTENSVLCSDGAWPYVTIAEEVNCDHKRLVNDKDRVLDKVYHIQTVNGAIAHFKSWVNGKMKGVATKYLANYLAWFKESSAKLDFQQILVAAYGGQQYYGT